MSLTEDLRQFAQTSGIDLLGITSARPFLVGDEQRKVDPADYLPGARSLVITACYVYWGLKEDPPSIPGKPRGKVRSCSWRSRAARHYSERLISEYLVSAGYSTAISNKIPFKMAAVRSGIAYYGKNCLVHAEGFGSYLELGCVITDAPMEAIDLSVERTDCGGCTVCVDGCPSGAIDRPYHINRDQCVGRWIGDGLPIPREFREKVGNRILICRACHEVCPLNRDLVPRKRTPFEVEEIDDSPELIPLLLGDAEYYRRALPSLDVSGRLDMLHRNVAVALGNAGDPAAIPALARALGYTHAETRSAAAWALGKLGGEAARNALAQALSVESDTEARAEIQSALMLAAFSQ